QADDGIRDRNVTGVQTCALPISAGGRDPEPFTPVRPTAPVVAGVDLSESSRPVLLLAAQHAQRLEAPLQVLTAMPPPREWKYWRSEERRGGKERRPKGTAM